jgi:signal peptidase I
MPDGLMGHDYHGILINEAFYLFKTSQEISAKYQATIQELVTKGKEQGEADSLANLILLDDYIANINYWKNQAREKLARGEFPGDPVEQRHGGLIYRPVDKRENYIKRCVGLPGDWLEIKSSVLYVNGEKEEEKGKDYLCLKYHVDKSSVTFPGSSIMMNRYGLEINPNGTRTDFDYSNESYYILNITKTEKGKIQKDFPKAKFIIAPADRMYPEFGNYQLVENLRTFPKDLYIQNTVVDFQRFQIPKKGQTISISTKNIAWYRRIITAYEGHKLEERKDGIYIDGRKTSKYTFSLNYYWLMGDNRYNSADSRIWGFVPEDHIVGHASLVWFSKSSDPSIGIRWDRLFKLIK